AEQRPRGEEGLPAVQVSRTDLAADPQGSGVLREQGPVEVEEGEGHGDERLGVLLRGGKKPAAGQKARDLFPGPGLRGRQASAMRGWATCMMPLRTVTRGRLSQRQLPQ